MKHLFNRALLICVLPVILSSCVEDKDYVDVIQPAREVKVGFVFSTKVDSAILKTGQVIYTNGAGNVYGVDNMKYYVSNFTLINANGVETNAANYKLVDVSNPTSGEFELKSFEAGEYTTLRFFLGIDSTRNFSGPQTGDLDPINGMLWDWTSGYIFYKHEGKFIDSTGNQEGVWYHYGTMAALAVIEIPVNIQLSKNHKPVIHINLNINSLYSYPNLIDFNNNYIHQSNGPNDFQWLKEMKENFQFAFELDHID